MMAEGFGFKDATEEFQPVLKAYTAHSSKIVRQFCVSASLAYSLCKLTCQAASSVRHELAPEPLYPMAASSTMLDTDASWNEMSAFNNRGLHDICMAGHLITMRGSFLVLVSMLTSVHREPGNTNLDAGTEEEPLLPPARHSKLTIRVGPRTTKEGNSRTYGDSGPQFPMISLCWWGAKVGRKDATWDCA